MNYQVLARKWRPRTFESLMGQSHVCKALINALNKERLHHAYLFSGTRGVGKTTVARILAKALNCEQGVSATPCLQCNHCLAIEAGNFVDLIEIDAASRTRVEDTRELLDNVQYLPTQGRFKVYLIDEVHMLSSHSFNALLKTLEEPPAHVKFILATTDPEKLPVTVLSRCMRFHLKNMLPESIVQHLAMILKEEQINFETLALKEIANAAKGSMRDALSLLDQAIAHSDEVLTYNDVCQMLGLIDYSELYHLLNALIEQDAKVLFKLCDQLWLKGVDFDKTLDSLTTLLHQIAIKQVCPTLSVDCLIDEKKLNTLVENLNAQEVQLFYQIALKGKEELRLAAAPNLGFEMVMLRMLAFRPAQKVNLKDLSAYSIDKGDCLEKAELATESSDLRQIKGTPSRSLADINHQINVANIEPPLTKKASNPLAMPGNCQPLANESPPLRTELNTEEESATSSEESIQQTLNDWPLLLKSISLKGVAHTIIQHAILSKVHGQTIYLSLEKGHQSLVNPAVSERVTKALSDYLQTKCKVIFEFKDGQLDSPARKEQKKEQNRKTEAVENIKNDPGIKTVIEQFSGELIEDSIIPADPSL